MATKALSVLLLGLAGWIGTPPSAGVASCTCSMSVSTTANDGREAGLSVAGCGQCIGAFTEMIDVTKGVCTGDHCAAKGKCAGKLKVELTSNSQVCCAASAGGFRPSWGSGWIAAGGGHVHTFDSLKVNCNGTVTTTWTLTWRNAQGTQVTQTINSVMACSNCDGIPD